MTSASLKEVQIPISGMTCAACATRIEKGLNKVKGVENATVNLALEKATVKYNPELAQMDAFEKKIHDLGYEVVQEKVDFDLVGMTCAACATRIEKGLNKMDGVKNATVNLALESATVEYNPSEVSVQDMIEKVSKIGYEAKLRQDQKETADFREQDLEKQKGKFLFSLILSLPLLWSMVGHFEFTSFVYVPDIVHEPMGTNGPGHTCTVCDRQAVLCWGL